MIISEFLPNPIGKDTEGEWIKLFNDGDTAINLNGWQLKDASGKIFLFHDFKIGPDKYLTLDYKTTKISLNNDGETLFLYDSKGDLVSKAEYAGSAPEGKSLIRQSDGQLIFSNQDAPEQAGSIEIQNQNSNAAVISDINQNNILNKKELGLSGLFIGFLSALILAFVFIVIFSAIGRCASGTKKIK